MENLRKLRCSCSLALVAGAIVVAPGCSSDKDTAAPKMPAPDGGVVTTPAATPPAGQSTPMPVVVAAPDERRTQAEQALAALTSPTVTPEEWDTAHNRLVELGPAAVRVLAEALGSAEPLRREVAATVLAGLGPGASGAEQALLAALNDESPFVQANAATALCAIPGHEQHVIPVLTKLLTSDDPQLRQLAATNLGNFGSEAAPFVPQLADALDGGTTDVVLPVVELLGRIGPAAEAAVPKLQQIAFEQEGAARTAATAALEQISPPARE
jgi:HEAT repeat protein